MTVESASAVSLRDLSFSYPGAQEPLFANLTATLPLGFTGVVGANGTGKSTLLSLIVGALESTEGSIQGVTQALYCEQRTDQTPPGFTQFLEDWGSDAFALRGRLGIDVDFEKRWSVLSHGERKRAQIAHALWRDPGVLAIDEPTNHIDSAARELLLESLLRYRGVGIIVSHDRALLDALCQQCLWLDPPQATVYSGNFSEAAAQRQQSRLSARRERETAVRAHQQTQREIVRRRERASRADRQRSKRGLSAKDHDAREKIDRARVTGKDGQAGRLLRQLQGQGARSEARVAATQVRKEYDTGIWLPGSRSPRGHLLQIEAGRLELGLAPDSGSMRTLSYPGLSIAGDARVALTGLNGVGKTTLLNYLLTQVNVPGDRLIVMPQEITVPQAQQILQRARTLDKENLGHVMNIVSRLGSRPQRLLGSDQPSPGEVRKLLLALGMARAPYLIVMDEPTNHLDLPSIEALETALAQCPCGLLLISHDARFLERLVQHHWHIEQAGDLSFRLEVE